jgi:hypothetical protein
VGCGLHFSEKLKKKLFIHSFSFIHPFTHSHPGTDKRPVKAAAVQWDVNLTPITTIIPEVLEEIETRLKMKFWENSFCKYLLVNSKTVIILSTFQNPEQNKTIIAPVLFMTVKEGTLWGNKWDFRFSRRRVWRWLPSVMLPRIVW